MDYSLCDSLCDSHQCSRIDEMLEIRYMVRCVNEDSKTVSKKGVNTLFKMFILKKKGTPI